VNRRFAVALLWLSVLSAQTTAEDWRLQPIGPPPPAGWQPPEAWSVGPPVEPEPASEAVPPVSKPPQLQTDVKLSFKPFESVTSGAMPGLSADFGFARVDLPALSTDRVVSSGRPAHTAQTEAQGEFWETGLGLVLHRPGTGDREASRTLFQMRFDGLRADADAVTEVPPSAKTINVDGTSGAALGGGQIEDDYRFESESMALLIQDVGLHAEEAHVGPFLEFSLTDADLTYDSLFTGSSMSSPTRPLHQISLEQRSCGAMLGLNVRHPLGGGWWLTGVAGAGIYATDADLRAFDPTSLASAQDDQRLTSLRGLGRLGVEHREPGSPWSMGAFVEADCWACPPLRRRPQQVPRRGSSATSVWICGSACTSRFGFDAPGVGG